MRHRQRQTPCSHAGSLRESTVSRAIGCLSSVKRFHEDHGVQYRGTRYNIRVSIKPGEWAVTIYPPDRPPID
jgi:hypothetical protein